MRKKYLVIVLAVAGGFAAAICLYWLADHYVIKMPGDTAIIHKRKVTLRNTFIDARDWDSRDMDAHPDVKRALLASGYRDYLADLRRRDIEDNIQDIGEAMNDLARNAGEAIDDWLKDLDPKR